MRNLTLPFALLILPAVAAHAQTVARFPGTPALRYADIEIGARPDSLGGAVVVRATRTDTAAPIELTLPVSTVRAWLAYDPVGWIDAQRHDTAAAPGLVAYPGEVLEGATGGLFLGVKHVGEGIEYHLLVRNSDRMLVRVLAADEALAVAYALRHAAHVAEGSHG